MTITELLLIRGAEDEEMNEMTLIGYFWVHTLARDHHLVHQLKRLCRAMSYVA